MLADFPFHFRPLNAFDLGAQWTVPGPVIIITVTFHFHRDASFAVPHLLQVGPSKDGDCVPICLQWWCHRLQLSPPVVSRAGWLFKSPSLFSISITQKCSSWWHFPFPYTGQRSCLYSLFFWLLRTIKGVGANTAFKTTWTWASNHEILRSGWAQPSKWKREGISSVPPGVAEPALLDTLIAV